MSNVLRLMSSHRASRISRLTLLALFTIHFSLFTVSSLRAEEWGIAYSGQLLLTENGVKSPVVYRGATNFAANVYIRLYDESEGVVTEKGKALWGRKISVNTRNAMFSCELKDSAGTKLTAQYETLQEAFAHLAGDRVTVGVTPFEDTNDEISPRQSLASVPFAVNAGDALGTVGDVTVGGTLTIGAAKVPSASFGGPVTHDGETTFRSSTTLRELALGDSSPLTAGTLVAGSGVAVSAAETGKLTAENVEMTVKDVASASFSNLTVSGAVEANRLQAIDKKLTVTRSVTASTVKADALVLGGTFDFFKWKNDIVTIENGTGVTEWHGAPGAGDWTVPTLADGFDGDIFVSVSFRVIGPLVVSIDGAAVATLNASGANFGGDEDGTWMPFQAFLARGQKISWSGSAKEVRFRYRQFTY